jgi:plasmid rolling circle replication initiator protein Rep
LGAFVEQPPIEWHVRSLGRCRQYEVNEEKYFELLEEWQQKRLAQLVASGEVLDNFERNKVGLEVICDCPSCPDLPIGPALVPPL